MNSAKMLLSLHEQPADEVAWLALADCLEEEGQSERAELLRMQRQLATCQTAAQRDRYQRRLRTLLTAGIRPCMPRVRLPLKNGVFLEAALIPPGSFLMGCNPRERGHDSDERPQHRVTITRPFYLGITPVTQQQWTAVMKSNPSRFRSPQNPVDQVLFADCESFCERLSKQVGCTVRLPSEAEWEYACRAGTTWACPLGQNQAAISKMACCDCERTQPVALLLPNPFGLYDMLGNVWEWTTDTYPNYTAAEQVDPNLIDHSNTEIRTARGGSYSNPPQVCRSATRIGFMTGGRNDFIGFRVVIEWPAPGAERC